jgi:hypothetical protein
VTVPSGPAPEIVVRRQDDGLARRIDHRRKTSRGRGARRFVAGPATRALRCAVDLSRERSASADERELGVASMLGRSLKIALAMLILVLVGIGLSSWLGGDPSTLPVDYEGFD